MSVEFFETTIGEQVTLQRGFDITKKEQVDGDVPVVSSGGISSFHNKAMVAGPGVVLGRKGSLGTVFYIPEDFWPHDTSLWVKDFKGNNPRFVYYFFKKMSEVLKKMDVGAANPALNRNHVHPLPAKWTDRKTQDYIVTVLSSFDDKIELNRQINQTLEQIAQTIFKSWFVDFEPVKAKTEAKAAGRDPEHAAMCAISGKLELELDQLPYEQRQQLAATAALFPDELVESELGLIPGGWEVGTLQDLLILQRGFDLPTSKRREGSFPIIAASGPVGFHEEPMVKAPGVVTGRSGVLGKVFLALEEFWPLNTTLWVKEFKKATPLFAFHLLRRLDFKVFNSGSAVPSLNRNHIHGLRQLLPEDEVVSEFERFAMSIFKAIQEREKESQVLATHRDTLLPKLLSAEVNCLEVSK